MPRFIQHRATYEQLESIAKGSWNIIKGRLKQAHGSLTDDDLKKTEGDPREAAGLIQKRTGESREAIQKRLDEIGGEP